MTRKTEQERLADLEMKMQQLKAQKQRLESRVKLKERKERTRRLIQIGAIFEKWCDIQSTEEAELVAHAISEQVKEKLARWRESKSSHEAGE